MLKDFYKNSILGVLAGSKGHIKITFLDPRHLPEGSYKFMFVRPSVRPSVCASVTAFLGIRSLDFSDFLHDDVVQ